MPAQTTERAQTTRTVQTTQPAHPRVFYGWIVVAAAFAVTFVGFGSAYTFSTFVGPLQHEFGASRGSVSLVFSLAGFLYFPGRPLHTQAVQFRPAERFV